MKGRPKQLSCYFNNSSLYDTASSKLSGSLFTILAAKIYMKSVDVMADYLKNGLFTQLQKDLNET